MLKIKGLLSQDFERLIRIILFIETKPKHRLSDFSVENIVSLAEIIGRHKM